jgi:hypothetical protein
MSNYDSEMLQPYANDPQEVCDRCGKVVPPDELSCLHCGHENGQTYPDCECEGCVEHAMCRAEARMEGDR